MAEESPIIVMPTAPERVQMLRERLYAAADEFMERRYMPPDCQAYRVTLVTLDDKLIEEGKVATFDLYRDMCRRFGSGFKSTEFQSACAVVDDIAKTGGANRRRTA